MSFAPHHIAAAVSLNDADDERLTHEVVDAAVDVALRFQVPLTMITVLTPLFPSAYLGPEPANVPPDWFEAAAQAQQRDAEKKMAALVARAQARGATCHALINFSPGSVAQQICDGATAAGADLLVLCTHGRKGFQRMLLGSVAERVSHLSTMPVLLVRPPT